METTDYRTTLGDLISLFYEEYMKQYGDTELASLATAVSVNQILMREAERGTARRDPEHFPEANAA